MTGYDVFTIGKMSAPLFPLTMAEIAILTAWPGTVLWLPTLTG